MKKINVLLFTLLAAATALSGCSKEPSFTVRGTVAIPEMEGKQVMLTSRWIKGGTPTRDSTVVADGAYTFTGSVEAPDGYTITIDPSDRENAIRINIALENAEISIDTDADGWSTVSGTPYNDKLQEFANARRAPYERQMEAYRAMRDARDAGTLTPELAESLNAERGKAHEEVQRITYEFVKDNINNPGFWGMTLNNIAISSPLDKQKKLIAGADERTMQQPELVDIIARIAALERTAVGQPFVDIRMPGPDGKEIAVSDYAGKGKYVLIDFWASWCGPCRAEMPNVLAAYKKYKDKGLEIVGVSFDNTHEAWLKGIDDLGMPWPQMSDMKGWDSEGADLYAVTGIPCTILLDRDGTIIARNIRGEELERKFAELMK